MKRTTILILICTSLLGLFALSGCSRDPNVRKQKYLESGKRYADKGEYREAIIQFANSLQVDPRFAEAHYQLAQAYMKTGNWNGAYGELLRTIDIQPDHLKAQLDLGNIFLAQSANGALTPDQRTKFRQDARAKAELVLQKEPNNAGAYALLANTLAAQQNIADAIANMQKALDLDPKNATYVENMAYLQAGSKQFGLAEENFKKAVALNPSSAQPLMMLAAFYTSQQRTADAEQSLQKATRVDPKNVASYVALARFYLSQNNSAQAEQVMTSAKQVLKDDPKGYEILGDYYVGTNQRDKALAEFASLQKDHPKDVRLKKAYISLLLSAQRFDDAARLNDEILKDNKKDADALVSQGRILIARGKPAEAITALESALKNTPDNPELHYQLGVAADMNGTPDRAEKEWRQAIQLQSPPKKPGPSMIPAEQAMAAVAIRKGDWDSLTDTAEQLIKLEPMAPGGYIFRAAAKAARNQWDGAESDLKMAIQVAPQNPVAYTKLAQLKVAQKKLGEAESLLNQALDRDPGSYEAMLSLTQIYESQKQLPKAIARVQQQIAKVPNSSPLYTLLAGLQLDSKNIPGAQSSLQKALQLNQNNLDALTLMTRIEVTQGLSSKAISDWESWIGRNPQDIRGYMILAPLQEQANNWQRAQQLYQKVLELKPDFAPAANNLAYLMLEHGGNVDVALSLAQTARQAMASSPSTADTLAWAYYHKGQYSAAIGLLKDASKQQPENATFHYHLGLAYEKNNDKTAAKDEFQKALKLNPKSDEIRKALSAA